MVEKSNSIEGKDDLTRDCSVALRCSAYESLFEPGKSALSNLSADLKPDSAERYLNNNFKIVDYRTGESPRPPVKGWKEKSSPTPVADPISTAKIFDKSGQEIRKDNGKLAAGDYIVRFGDNRTFAMHVPQKATGASLYVFQGSMEPNWKQEDFEKQTEMNKESDKMGFTTVYIHPAKHALGQYSKDAAWAYNAPNSMIDEKNLAQSGYNDNVYVDNVQKLLPQIAKIDGSAHKTAAIAFSQGGAFLLQYLQRHENFAETVGFVGTAFPDGKLAPMAGGNARTVLLVNLLDDKDILPKEGEESWSYLAQKLARAIATEKTIDHADPLAPIRNDKIQDAERLLRRAKHYPGSIESIEDIGENPGEDILTSIEYPDGYQYYQMDFAKAKHAYPSLNSDGVQTSSAKSYPYPLSEKFAQIFSEQLEQKEP